MDEIAERGGGRSALLLSWARKPPAGVDKLGLEVGLADAFGRLRTRDAIPFLIANITLQRGLFYRADIWMKTPQVVEGALPAVAALIRIGPEASRSLIRKFPTLSAEDRLAAIFVVSRISGVPEAQDFLNSVIGGARLEAFWARGGAVAVGCGVRNEQFLSRGACEQPDVTTLNDEVFLFMNGKGTGYGMAAADRRPT